MKLKWNAKKIIVALVLFIVFVTFIVCVGALGVKPIGSADGTQITVVLDAGHGGVDGGVTGVNTGVRESELNLAVVKKLESLFLERGDGPRADARFGCRALRRGDEPALKSGICWRARRRSNMRMQISSYPCT